MIEIFAALGVSVGLMAGCLQIWQHFKRSPKILNPNDGAECGGRYVTLSGIVPRRKWRARYWIAIQPSDCRGSGAWWPQGHELVFGRKGAWLLERATLGRVGQVDVGATYTLGLFEVLPGAREAFSKMAGMGERLKLVDVSEYCNQLHTIEVKRVRQ